MSIVQEQTKTCSKCSEEKPLEEFHRNKSKLLGRESQCKDCKNPNRVVRPVAPEVAEGFKYCYTCENVKSVCSFSKDNSKKDGLQVKCKDCDAQYRKDNKSSIKSYMRVYGRKHYRENKESKSRYGREYFKLNASIARERRQRRRALRRGADDDGSTNESVIARWGGTCYLCGVPVAEDGKPLESYHLEHVVPLSKGGSHTIDNLRPSCAKDNLSKGAGVLISYLALRQPSDLVVTEADSSEYAEECRRLDAGMICVGYSASRAAL